MKQTHKILLLVVLVVLLLSPFKANAETASKATSRAGITFVDRRPHTDDSNSSETATPPTEDNRTSSKGGSNFPSTNEKTNIYSFIFGLALVFLSVIYLWKRNKKQKSRNG